MSRWRSFCLAVLLGLGGALLLRAGAGCLAGGLPCLFRAASRLAQAGGPSACLVWEGSDGQRSLRTCLGWREGRLRLSVEGGRAER